MPRRLVSVPLGFTDVSTAERPFEPRTSEHLPAFQHRVSPPSTAAMTTLRVQVGSPAGTPRALTPRGLTLLLRPGEGGEDLPLPPDLETGGPLTSRSSVGGTPRERSRRSTPRLPAGTLESPRVSGVSLVGELGGAVSRSAAMLVRHRSGVWEAPAEVGSTCCARLSRCGLLRGRSSLRSNGGPPSARTKRLTRRPPGCEAATPTREQAAGAGGCRG